MKTYHHTSNSYIENSKLNIDWYDLFQMSDKSFKKYVKDLKKLIKDSWIEHNQPPVKTIPDDEIVRQMKRLTNLDCSLDLQTDQLTQETDCVVMRSPISAANGFFPNMGKMKDIQTKELTGYSLWDYFVEDENPETVFREIRRLIRNDGLYNFSQTILKATPNSKGLTTGEKWITDFTKNFDEDWVYWIQNFSGKSPRGQLNLNEKSFNKLLDKGLLTVANCEGGDLKKIDPTLPIRVRLYKKGQRIFPSGFTCLIQGIVKMGVNFPPSISKTIYQHFTEDLKDQEKIIIYDPSSGYGGRLLGALSLCGDRRIHYIGTDPNPDHWIEDLEISRYEYLGKYFNSEIKRKHETTLEIFQLGSEVVHKEKNFKRYKGKIDFIFTSPPYFAAEGYSEDENQSFKKFPTYEEWRDGFLTQTLKTCVEYLKPNRWMCWNIADVSFGSRFYPLERDSVEIMKSLGMRYEHRWKMVLSGSVSKREISDRRVPSRKNYCCLRSSYRTYEPIFCFYKPE